ncbi:MAG: UDP-N-acetylmuramate dehydrogenase [Bacteroidota bacterium]
MNILQNISLEPYNTFGIAVNARFFIQINHVKELREALELKGYPERFILGGGSNMLLTHNLEALVLHIDLRGKTIVSENDTQVFLKVMAGENWHQLVLWTLERDYGGLENMSLIPGNTGTAPIQNIGAYGVELKDVFEGCEALDTQDGSLRWFTPEECEFGYRDSYFKNRGKGRYILVSVTLKLTKVHHKLNTSYGAIESELARNGVKEPSIKDIAKAVIAIRKSKLPDPEILGNSGSFFKNPVVDGKTFGQFIKKHPDAPHYRVSKDRFKIPAGWLIEQCGFKGKRYGDAGVHSKQALVLVNHGKATGREILALAHKIMDQVRETFAIAIQPEVNIIE